MLHTLADNLEVIWGLLLAASIVVLLTPAVGGMARLLGVVDRPGGRRLNRSTVPRLGGIALFFGIFVPALAFLDLSGETRGLLLGAAVATTVGAVDDFRGLRRDRVVTHSRIRRPDTKAYHGGYDAEGYAASEIPVER